MFDYALKTKGLWVCVVRDYTAATSPSPGFTMEQATEEALCCVLLLVVGRTLQHANEQSLFLDGQEA